MAWNPPSTAVSGTVITSAAFNQVKESLEYLKGLAGPVSLSDALVGATLLDSNQTMRMRLWTSASAFSTTAQTVIADGTGDVTLMAYAAGWWRENGGTGYGVINGANARPGDTWTTALTVSGGDGSINFSFRVNANGSVEVFTNDATPTINIGIIVLWR
jgi:hypothetical protein